jgi:hypothetical protein
MRVLARTRRALVLDRRRRMGEGAPEHPRAPATGNMDWITPVVYKGKSEEPSAIKKIVRGVRTLQDMFLVYVGHVKRMFG